MLRGPADIGRDCPNPSYPYVYAGITDCCCSDGCCWNGCSWSTPPADCLEGIPSSQWIYNKQAGNYHVFIGMYICLNLFLDRYTETHCLDLDLNGKRPGIRWVSVVEFHDPTLDIDKVFGQESTVVKWNYQISGLHPVMVCQKLGVILVIKWFKNWSQQKMLFTKKVRLNWYSSMNFFFERFGWFLT